MFLLSVPLRLSPREKSLVQRDQGEDDINLDVHLSGHIHLINLQEPTYRLFLKNIELKCTCKPHSFLMNVWSSEDFI